MKGLLSLVLVSIALLQTAAAAPTVSERSQAVKKSEGEQNVGKRSYISFQNNPPEDDEVLTGTTETETEDIEKRAMGRVAAYRPPVDDEE
ncbi:hypothetical protein DFJ58DRAFT_814132 [Suillus subalutaceus]|uniref:uncharacterized protein n=1 Tax=Suillus subalutaceus TaxID=48586 RepID=UPI001B870949|nr:uncharacterized protein DFJ58DRAFT_814132 [Suillus subalutaceus]KAG1838356.1 hypothetical protein DFJ58DRAFT_814132 [Suillus subalutaceus]